MHAIWPFLLLWTAATISPGPDFLLVSRLSLSRGLGQAARASLGIAVGILLWGIAGALGVNILFASMPWLYWGVRLCGGVYLIWMGGMLIVGSFHRAPEGVRGTLPSTEIPSFRLGLLTNLSNPKVAVFVSGLFAATLPREASTGLLALIVLLMFAIVLGWFLLVARFFAVERLAAAFRRVGHVVDRLAGLAFLGFGAKFLLEILS